MDRQTVLKLEPGRELDVEVARVLGWTGFCEVTVRSGSPDLPPLVEWEGYPTGLEEVREIVPYYSTSWEDAGKAVEEWVESTEYGKLRLSGSNYHGWYCGLLWGPGNQGEGSVPPVPGESGPHAFCRALLLASLEGWKPGEISRIIRKR
jgi:hypothetical protein